MKEHLIKAATLLPWWVNLILAEVSFIALHLMSCSYGQFIVPALFIGASMIATAENEKRRKEELRRAREKQADDMLVTKVILKDLMKGGYREIEQKSGMRREEPERPDFSKYMIIGMIAVAGIGSSMIMMEEIGKGFKEGVELAHLPSKNAAEYIPPRPAIQRKPAPVRRKPRIKKYTETDYRKYRYKIDLSKKTVGKDEQIIGYTVFFKNGISIKCKHVLRLHKGSLIFLDENHRKKDEAADFYIRDMERECKIPGGHKVTVLRPDDFY